MGGGVKNNVWRNRRKRAEGRTNNKEKYGRKGKEKTEGGELGGNKVDGGCREKEEKEE